MSLWQERFVVKARRARGSDPVILFTFTTRSDAEDMIPHIAKCFNEDIEDLYVGEVKHIPSTQIENLKESLVGVKALIDQEAQEVKDREKYLRKNPHLYWNSSLEDYKEKPTPAWSRFNDNGWWRYVSPEMFFADEDYYRELFEDFGGMMLTALASRGTYSMVEQQQKEMKNMTIYEKAIREGESVNINDASGYNTFDVIEVVYSDTEPMEAGHGLSGILMTDGQFHPCKYGGHADLLDKLRDIYPEVITDHYIRSDRDVEGDMVIFLSHGSSVVPPYDTISVANRQGTNLTDESREWLEDNKQYLSEDQQSIVERYLEVD